MRRYLFRILSSFMLLGALASGPLLAQSNYPDRTVTIVTPFPAGGATDILARAIADSLSAELRQSVIVENRPGAGTTIGAAHVSRAKPDGYTLLLATNTTLVSSPFLHEELGFEPESFVPVGIIGYTPMVLLTAKQTGFSSIEDVVAAAQENPGKLTIASFGVGNTSHLTSEHFQNITDIELLHVPFKGSTEVFPQMANGEIDLFFDGVTTAIPPVENGQVDALGVSSAQRMSTLPDLPTIAEQGFADFEMIAWFSLVAPEGTPEEIQSILSKALKTVLTEEKVRENMLKIGIEPADGSAEEISERMHNEQPILKELIESIGVAAN